MLSEVSLVAFLADRLHDVELPLDGHRGGLPHRGEEVSYREDTDPGYAPFW